MQISSIKNKNFEKTSRNPSTRTKVKIKKKTFLESPRKCSNIENLAKIEIENLRRAYKDLI